MNSEVRLVVIGGLIAGVAGLGGALLGSCATIVTQRDQAQESRQAEARVRRASVYKTFLDDAEGFAYRTRRFASSVETLIAGKNRGLLSPCLEPALSSKNPGNEPLSKRCEAFVNRIDAGRLEGCTSQVRTRPCRAYYDARTAYQSQRADFQGALNNVYIYGSRDGVRAARRIAGGLPPALFTKEPTFYITVEDRKVSDGYSALLDVMCKEVSADPRPNC